jgi:hypothetical protein
VNPSIPPDIVAQAGSLLCRRLAVGKAVAEFVIDISGIIGTFVHRAAGFSKKFPARGLDFP